MDKIVGCFIGLLLGCFFAQLLFLIFGPYSIFVLLVLMLLRSNARQQRILEWARAQHIPEGDWLVQLNVFTDAGCKKTEERIRGEFEQIVPYIGIRTPEEVERIRTMVMEALEVEGGYNWVTLYNPIGIAKELEAQASSTITIQFTPTWKDNNLTRRT